jgi:hypothetical protein
MRKTSLILLFITGCLLLGCQRDNISIPEDANADLQANTVVDPCATCVDHDLVKTPGTPNNVDEVAGTLQVCQPNTTEITFTFTVSGDREDAWFNQTGIRIDVSGTGFTELNPGAIQRDNTHGDKLRQVTYTFTLEELGVIPGSTICVAAYAVVPGQDGVGGQVWAGTVPTTQGNPHPRSFCYVVKDCETEEPPTANCTFTQGYWFAKAGGWTGTGKNKVATGSHWPGSLETTGISFGGFTYTYAEARAIFFGSNKKTGKTDAKQAFLQGLSLKLSMYGNQFQEPCTGTLAALETIENYFISKSKVLPSTINTSAYPSNADIRTAAGIISDCLNESHCDNTPIPAGQ